MSALATWVARLSGAGLALYLRLVARTARLSGPVTHDQVVLAFWHEYNLATFVAALKARRSLPHASFSTVGFRGTVVDTQLRLSGTRVRVIALPPEGDRAAAAVFARRLSRLADEGFSLIVTPDGPFGPRRVAKPGALIMARESGLPIQPWAFRMSPSLRLTARWDRMLLPLPFCRIRVVAGEPMRIGPRDRLKARLGELQSELDRAADQG